jgi:hypothetical protein
MKQLNVVKAVATSLTVERVAKLADEACIQLTHVEVRMAGKGKWINDFEVSGPPGKVAGFFERLEEIRRD